MQDIDGRAPTVFMVTSAIPSEGKSTVAANLGVAIAFTASRTLVIDADLRRGHLDAQFGLKKKPGLSEYLMGQASLDEVVQHTHMAELDFISAGNYPERPGELLLSTRMETLVDILRKRYDYVICDTAPILATDDTTGFSVKGDSVLFVIRSAQTQTRQVVASLDRLKQRGANISGFILNCVDTQGADYYYYKKYNDYYAQGSQL
jgi:tyrosine-protein kinase Etk/Wzc